MIQIHSAATGDPTWSPYYVDFAGGGNGDGGPSRRSRERAADGVPIIGCAPLRHLSERVLYVETPRFAADRINAALGATAGTFPDQPNIIATAD
jgi:hypothetical protein